MKHTSKGKEGSKGRAIAMGAVAVALFAVVAEHPSTRFNAQSPAASSAIPDLTEIWHRKGPLDGKPNSPVVPTARAVGFDAAFDQVLQPTYDCSPIPVPGLMNDNYDFQIIQQADRVIIRYEKMDVVRTVWLEGHGHPKPGAYDYMIQGHSVGRYEGSRLVVETTKFAFDPRGFNSNRFIPGSTMKKMTERYWREGNTLKMESVSEDPLVLKQPFHYNFEWIPRTEELTPYDCDPEDSRFGAQFHPSKYPVDK
jgi:hypothetical protein